MCKAWRRFLDPRQWPIDWLFVDDYSSEGLCSLASWVATVQPAVRKLNLFPKEPLASIQHAAQLLYIMLSISPRMVGAAGLLVEYHT